MGGFIVPFNVHTGELLGYARTEDGDYHYEHPGAHLKFTGVIPQWEQLIKLNEKVHMLMSDHIYLGNDYALTSHGWVLVECNWGQFIAQYTTQIGVKNEFKILLEK